MHHDHLRVIASSMIMISSVKMVCPQKEISLEVSFTSRPMQDLNH